HLVVQRKFVATLAANAPARGRRLEDRDLDILGGNANLPLDALEEQADQPSLRLLRATREHADLDDGVSIRPVGRVDEVLGIQREKALELLRLRQSQRLHEAAVDAVRELLAVGSEDIPMTVDLYLGHGWTHSLPKPLVGTMRCTDSIA